LEQVIEKLRKDGLLWVIFYLTKITMEQ
jgi:hypothetical protein